MPIKPPAMTELACEAFEEYAASMQIPLYRARQLRKWVYQNLALDFEEMTDLPLALRERLDREISLHTLEPVQKVAGADGTVKMLLRLADGKTVETALMFYGGEGGAERRTVCVSTQVGCSISCPFCATGQQRFARNLTAGEIIDQVLYFARFLKNQSINDETGERVSNIVFMGMGEPLANYENLWQAIETLNAPACFGLGARNMVISTAGMVPQIKRLGREKLQVGLAVSLHASDNRLRDRLVPLNRKYPLEELLQACQEYSIMTGRRLSFEYILFSGVNDSISQARELAALVRGIKCHVNLIPANLTANRTFRPPPYRTVLAFEEELKKNHVNVTLRERRGQDIAAGCGQLRSRYLKEGGEGEAKKPGLEKVKNVS